MAGETPRRTGARRGQGLVEFALVLPVLLLVLLFAIDFGRLFGAVVSLNNAARIGASYAAAHPYAWDAIGSQIDIAQRADYRTEILRELTGANCPLDPDPVNPMPPTFPDNSLRFGDAAQTALKCRFTPLTPIISVIVGSSVPISSSAVFPIRVGVPGEEPPLPPCFNRTTVPDVEGKPLATANALITGALLLYQANPTYTGTGPKNVARNQDLAANTCAAVGATVTYEYKP